MKFAKSGVMTIFFLLTVLSLSVLPLHENASGTITLNFTGNTINNLNNHLVKDKFIEWTAGGSSGAVYYNMSYQVNNGSWIPIQLGLNNVYAVNTTYFAWNTQFLIDSRYYRLKLTANDSTGQYGEIYFPSEHGYFVIENFAEAPEVSIISIENPVNNSDILYWNNTINWRIRENDYGDIITLNADMSKKDGSTWGDYQEIPGFGSKTYNMSSDDVYRYDSHVWNVSFLERGEYRLRLRITDSTQNTAQAVSGTFFIDSMSSPTSVLVSNRTDVFTSDSINFSASESYDINTYGSIVRYRFNMGDGYITDWVTQPYLNYNYSLPGVYTPSVSVEDNDGNISVNTNNSVSITVRNRPPVPLYEIYYEDNITNVPVIFDATSSYDPDGSIVTYIWKFNDAYSNSSNPSTSHSINSTHIFTRPGTYNVALYVMDNMGEFVEIYIPLVIKNRLPVIVVEYNNLSYIDIDIEFKSMSYDPDGTIVSTVWDMGDGTVLSGNNVNHVYRNKGNYTISISVFDGIGYTNDTFNITIANRLPVINIVSSSPTAFINSTSYWITSVNDDIYFEVQAYDIDGHITGYQWDISNNSVIDGTNSYLTIVFPQHGKSQINLKVFDNDGDYTEKTIWIFINRYPIPVITSDTEAAPFDFIRFDGSGSYDLDDNDTIVRYSWEFGDGGRAEGREVYYYYSRPDIYLVTLTVTDSFGASSSNTELNQIYYVVISGSQAASIGERERTTSINEPISFIASLNTNDTGNITYRWIFGDGSMGLGRNISHIYSSGGYYDVSLTILIEGIPRYFDYAIVYVHTGPDIRIRYRPVGKAFLAMGFDATATISSVGIINYRWEMGDGTIYDGYYPTVTHVYKNNNTYLVQLTITDSMNARSVKRVPVTIKNRMDSILETPGFESMFAVNAIILASVMIYGKRRYFIQ